MSSILLTNSTLVYEPKCGERGGVAGSQPMSTAIHRNQMNFGNLNPYLTYNLYPIPFQIYIKRNSEQHAAGDAF
jgi:hypothetical protein